MNRQQSAYQSSQEDERRFQTESLGRSVSEEAGLRESNEERSSENSSSIKNPLVAKMATMVIPLVAKMAAV